jgi:ubiquinol-cytochrome c reductase cytochrome b subunit
MQQCPFHYRGAMAMIVLVGLHLLRVFVSAAYKRPREGNWVIGVVLAAITAGLFFTGSVLKWDQESLEALEHNIEVGKPCAAASRSSSGRPRWSR